MAHHFIKVCTCGRVIAQCRCISPNKERIVVKNGCSVCQKKAAELSPPVAESHPAVVAATAAIRPEEV